MPMCCWLVWDCCSVVYSRVFSNTFSTSVGSEAFSPCLHVCLKIPRLLQMAMDEAETKLYEILVDASLRTNCGYYQ